MSCRQRNNATILKNKKYFCHLVMQDANVSTISGSANIIEGSGRANILLPEEQNCTLRVPYILQSLEEIY